MCRKVAPAADLARFFMSKSRKGDPGADDTPKRATYNVSNQKLCKVWAQEFVRGGTRVDVARRLKMPVGIVSSRASDLRSMGVKLPRLGRSKRSSRHIEELNQIIEEELRQQSEKEED